MFARGLDDVHKSFLGHKGVGAPCARRHEYRGLLRAGVDRALLHIGRRVAAAGEHAREKRRRRRRGVVVVARAARDDVAGARLGKDLSLIHI